jgi:hypothetical protein
MVVFVPLGQLENEAVFSLCTRSLHARSLAFRILGAILDAYLCQVVRHTTIYRMPSNLLPHIAQHATFLVMSSRNRVTLEI